MNFNFLKKINIFSIVSLALALFFVAFPVFGYFELVSKNELGEVDEDEESFPSVISGNGEYVVFVTAASLVSSDTNGNSDIYLFDIKNGQNEIISKNNLGELGNGSSYNPQISDGGRYIAFNSNATNLVENDINGETDLFIYDRLREEMFMISIMANISLAGIMGEESDPDNTYFIVFGVSNGYLTRVLYDSSINYTEIVSVIDLAPGLFFSNYNTNRIHSYNQEIVFSHPDDLLPEDTNGGFDVYLYNYLTEELELISKNDLGEGGNGFSAFPSISNDGRYVAYWSISSNLVGDDTNGNSDAFIYDRQLQTTRRISVDNQGQESSSFFIPEDAVSISGYGNYVFFSGPGNLAGESYSNDTIIIYDVVNESVSKIPGMNYFGSDVHPISASNNGQFITFSTGDLSQVQGFENQSGNYNVILYDRIQSYLNVTDYIYENEPIGTILSEIEFSSEDQDNYLISAAMSCVVPGDNDESFYIEDGYLKSAEVFDYETMSEYLICIRLETAKFTRDYPYYIMILDAVPTDIILTNNELNENNTIGFEIGELETTTTELDDVFTYSLSCDAPGADDGSFTIQDNKLLAGVSFDFETKNEYQICIRTDNGVGGTFDKNFTINVLDVNEGGSGSSGSGSSSGGTSGGGGTPVLPPVFPPHPPGCTDIDATNYNEFATIDDGSCMYTPGAIPGCTDTSAGNYNSIATVDNGSCLYGVFGCMDSSAVNFNPGAQHSDSSCLFAGCTNPASSNYNQDANFNDGSCLAPDATGGGSNSGVADDADRLGCMEPGAINYDESATVNDGSCSYVFLNTDDEIEIKKDSSIFKSIAGFLREIVEIISEPVVASVAVGGIVASSFIVAFLQPGLIAGLVSVPIRIWNTIPVLMGYRRRKRPWGTVYDSVTKQPLDPVYVTLKTEDGKDVSTSITDLDGRFGFLAAAGRYLISANKANYIFPSVKMAGKEKDELYENLYFGEQVEVKEKEDVIFKNIPMDAVNFNWNEFEKAKNKKLMKFYSKRDLFFARIATVLFVSGLVSSVVLFFLNNSVLNSIVLSLYVLIIVLRFFGIKPKTAGGVFDKDGYPLSFSIVRLFSSSLKKEVAHGVVGKTGKYYMLAPNGDYYIKVSKKTGEDSYEDVFTSADIKVSGGFVKEKIVI